MTCCGRLFQTRAAATGKARSAMVNDRIRRTINDGNEAERRRRLPSRFASRSNVCVNNVTCSEEWLSEALLCESHTPNRPLECNSNTNTLAVYNYKAVLLRW